MYIRTLRLNIYLTKQYTPRKRCLFFLCVCVCFLKNFVTETVFFCGGGGGGGGGVRGHNSFIMWSYKSASVASLHIGRAKFLLHDLFSHVPQSFGVGLVLSSVTGRLLFEFTEKRLRK